MSENLELVRSILAEWERGDFRSVDWADPQIEYAIVDEPGSQVGRGVAAMTRTWREFLTAWEDYRATRLHVTAEEADNWLASLEDGKDVEPPACHC